MPRSGGILVSLPRLIRGRRTAPTRRHENLTYSRPTVRDADAPEEWCAAQGIRFQAESRDVRITRLSNMPPQAISRNPKHMAIMLPALIPVSDVVALAAGVGLVAKSSALGNAASSPGAENAGLAGVVVLAAVAGADAGARGAA